MDARGTLRVPNEDGFMRAVSVPHGLICVQIHVLHSDGE
jgi:hypothetical protein